MALRSDRALVLRRAPYGESSLVVHLLTRRHGRVHLLAKGAHRPTSRYYAVLDWFDTLELEWSIRRDAELGLLRRGEIATRRRRITGELDRYRAALTALELAELAARPGQRDPELFALVEGFLDALDALEGGRAEPGLALVVFELRFLQNLGLAPALERCAACGGEAPPVSPGRAAFSAGAGGRLCPSCAGEARTSGRRVGTLPVAVLATAARLARPGPSSEPPPELPSRDLVLRLRDFVGRFLDYHLETRPTSHRRFLSASNRNAPDAGIPEP